MPYAGYAGWLPGSSLFSAQLAAMLGLPLAFVFQLAPDLMRRALDIYRERFEPSVQSKRPFAMLEFLPRRRKGVSMPIEYTICGCTR